MSKKFHPVFKDNGKVSSVYPLRLSRAEIVSSEGELIPNPNFFRYSSCTLSNWNARDFLALFGLNFETKEFEIEEFILLCKDFMLKDESAWNEMSPEDQIYFKQKLIDMIAVAVAGLARGATHIIIESVD